MNLAEDRDAVLSRVKERTATTSEKALLRAVRDYGAVRTRNFFGQNELHNGLAQRGKVTVSVHVKYGLSEIYKNNEKAETGYAYIGTDICARPLNLR